MASYNIETLDTEAKKRYKNKLEMIGMINCPYMLPADIWTNDPKIGQLLNIRKYTRTL